MSKGFRPVASSAKFEHLFDMGNNKEHFRFHTSVLCPDGDVQFLFAKGTTASGVAYVVTLQRSNSNQVNVRVERCSTKGGLPNQCTQSEWKVNSHSTI